MGQVDLEKMQRDLHNKAFERIIAILDEGKICFKTVSVWYDDTLMQVQEFADGWENCYLTVYVHSDGNTTLTMSWHMDDYEGRNRAVED